MFERFTDRARRAVVYAQEEAHNLQHSHIGTEHLLLALLRTPVESDSGGIAYTALSSFQINHRGAFDVVVEIIGEGSKPPSGSRQFTPRLKKALELSLREASQFGHNYIGTEHQLLGLIREGDGFAIQVLVKLGIDPSLVRRRVIEIMNGDVVRLQFNGQPCEITAGLSRVLTDAVKRAKQHGDVPSTEHLTAAMSSHMAG